MPSAAASARPFIAYCQDRYASTLAALVAANRQAREDAARMEAFDEERISLRQSQAALQAHLDEVRTRSQDTIHELLARLREVAANPDADAGARLLEQRRMLQASDAECGRLRRELDLAQQRCSALEASEDSLENAVAQLKTQSEAKSRRIQQLVEERDGLDHTCRDAIADRDHTLSQLRTGQDQAQKLRAKLKSKDHHIAVARTAVSKLEARVVELCSALASSKAEAAGAAREADRLRQDLQASRRSFKDLRGHCVSAYSRLSKIGSAMGHPIDLPQPPVLGQRSVPDGAASPPATKRRRTSATPASPSRPQDYVDPPAYAFPSGETAAQGSDPPQVGDGEQARGDQDQTPNFEFANASDGDDQDLAAEGTACNDRDGEERLTEQATTEDVEDDDAPELLAALSRSRSAFRRSSLSSDPEAAPDTSPEVVTISQASLEAEGSSQQPVELSDNASSDLDSDGDATSASEVPSPDDLDRELQEQVELRPATVPRSLWIPGFRHRRLVRRGDVRPWNHEKISKARIVSMTVSTLIKLLIPVSDWLFPKQGKAPKISEYEKLITGAAVRELMSKKPWLILRNSEALLTFEPGFMHPSFMEKYEQFEVKHLQALWESLHFLAITKAMMDRDPELAAYYEERRQRRCRAGESWRAFLVEVLAAIKIRACDLDIFLDPFFLHFPKSRSPKQWFPRLPVYEKSGSLLGALKIVDQEDPWRNHYRDCPQNHPAFKLTRLRNKFVPPS